MILKERLLRPLLAPHLPHYSVITVVKRLTIEVLVLAIFAFAALTSIAQAAPMPTETPTISSEPASSANPTPTADPATPTVSVQAVVRPTTPKANGAPTQRCTRGSIPSPTPLTLNMKQSGVTRVIDNPQYYKVHGDSLSAVKSQIAQCSPVENGRFAAITVSTINWQFAYYRDPWSNQCKLSNVAVGIHTGFLYPSWSTPTAQWNTFINNLQIHEQGHAERDLAAAYTILNDLQAIPFSDCATIAAIANSVANAKIASLHQSNTAYDADTNHGATQGAQL